jgi:hypothetical protein
MAEELPTETKKPTAGSGAYKEMEIESDKSDEGVEPEDKKARK